MNQFGPDKNYRGPGTLAGSAVVLFWSVRPSGRYRLITFRIAFPARLERVREGVACSLFSGPRADDIGRAEMDARIDTSVDHLVHSLSEAVPLARDRVHR